MRLLSLLFQEVMYGKSFVFYESESLETVSNSGIAIYVGVLPREKFYLHLSYQPDTQSTCNHLLVQRLLRFPTQPHKLTQHDHSFRS